MSISSILSFYGLDMNIVEIEKRLKELSIKDYDPTEFPYDLLEIYDTPKATLTKLRSGVMNKGEVPEELLWKGKFFFRNAPQGSALTVLESLKTSSARQTYKPRFLIASDGFEVCGWDAKTDDTIHCDIGSIYEKFDFLLPLIGVERFKSTSENPADVKAAVKLGTFYDAILEHNPEWKSEEYRHPLNLFMTRTLFCMFAEDTGILREDVFTKTMDEFTLEDGSDTHLVLSSIFDVMDRKENVRAGVPQFVHIFPYVNGGLFRDRTSVPKFSKKARRMLLEACDLRWNEINPDIFGSMIQAVVDPSMRGDLGMHYTSVPNIMKVIKPLFLDKLEEEFEASKGNPKRLERLLSRIYRIRVFDPACGSGNFLIISYRELRRLEMRIFKRLQEISPQFALPMSQVRLSQFYGIEYDDFAAETAKLSLWISEHQANKEFQDVFGSSRPSLPLTDSGHIVQGNALRIDWSTVCPVANNETYVVGNPPYLGSTYQSKHQKQDMEDVFKSVSKNYKSLDYVCGWFLKGARYCASHGAELAFVSTNSICQGEQVELLWPIIYELGIEIGFAHTSFKWKNNASSNAGVICVIVGIRSVKEARKFLFSESSFRMVSNIGPYLIEMGNDIVSKVSRPISNLPLMTKGDQPTDGGNLILSRDERDEIIAGTPQAEALMRRFYGSQEFIKGIERWCLWINEEQISFAKSISSISTRLDLVKAMRERSTKAATVRMAGKPHIFGEIRHQKSDHILIVPSVSSETRHYLPCGILDGQSIVSNLAFAIYDAPMHTLSVLSSKLHCIWIRTVCGQLKTDFRYSNTLGYNTFPIPDLSDMQKQKLEDCAWRIIEEREAHPGKTIADLYDPKTMPAGLLEAHRDLDVTLETIYRGRPFKDDTERLEHLFKLYAAKTGQLVKKGEAA